MKIVSKFLLVLAVLLSRHTLSGKNDYLHNRSTFTDPRDGKIYKTIVIGSQTWFAENLNYKTYNSWWYTNNSNYGEIYGRLYTWEAAKSACPSGWHLPSNNQWETLEIYLGMRKDVAEGTGWRGTDEATKLKSTYHWNKDVFGNGPGSNSSGFTGLPAGGRSIDGKFDDIGEDAAWWSATEASSSYAWYRLLYLGTTQINRYYWSKSKGLSVRCIKNKD